MEKVEKVLGFWNKSKEELAKFLELINSIHGSIRFSMEMNLRELSFLYTLIIKENDISIAKTRTAQQYLVFRPCHTSHTIKNISVNIVNRICTIVSETDRREKPLAELNPFLKNQNIPNQTNKPSENRS